MNKTLVSVIVPCYNQGKWLNEALDSIVSQTWNNWECIIINDGSDDNTEEVALSYVQKDHRIKYVYQANAGLVAARNNAIKESVGAIILPLDADDKIAPTYIEKAVPILERDTACKIVYSMTRLFGDQNKQFNLPHFSLYQILSDNCIPNSAFYRRTDFDKVGGYNPAFKYGWEDWNLWLSLLEHGGYAYRIDETQYYYRKHGVSLVTCANQHEKELRKLLMECHPELYLRYYRSLYERYSTLTSSRWYKLYNYYTKARKSLKDKQSTFKHLLFDPILTLYCRRQSQYTRTGKVALCCIAKMENSYIRFFVEYYKNLGFDKIIIYDNNDPEGEQFEEVIKDYIDSGFVELIDFRGRSVAQLAAYQDCYNRYNKKYDWIAFFDCDEFLTFTDNTLEIHQYLGQKTFLPYQVIHFNWRCYGDSDMLDDDGRDVIARFTSPIANTTRYIDGNVDVYVNEQVKSMVRGGLSRIYWILDPHTPESRYHIDPHTPKSRYHICCDAEGHKSDINSPFQKINHKVAFLRHYKTKTIGEWVRNKMRRGIPDRPEESWKEVIMIESFFEWNKKTDEKMSYALRVMKEIEEKK